MTSLDLDGIPANAIRVWSDGVRIYGAIPSIVGKPYIIHELLSEGGLNRILQILGATKANYDYVGKSVDKFSFLKPVSGAGTGNQQAMADKVLAMLKSGDLK